MGWRVISQPIPILEKTNVSLPNAYNSNEMIKTLEDPLYSIPTPRNASFTVTFPSSVSINETFDIEYTWIADPRYGTQHKNDKKGYTVISSVALEIEHVNLKSNGSDFSFNKLVSKTPELEFVSVRGDEIFHDCRREGYDRINLTSNNMDDRTGIFSAWIKYYSIPFYQFSISDVYGRYVNMCFISAKYGNWWKCKIGRRVLSKFVTKYTCSVIHIVGCKIDSIISLSSAIMENLITSDTNKFKFWCFAY